MSFFGDLAFAAVDNFIRTEIEKKIDAYISETGADLLLKKLSSGNRRGADLVIFGKLHAQLTGMKVEYTGTAMRKVSDRTVTIPDQTREIRVEKTLASPGPMKETDTIPEKAPSARISMELDLELADPGLEEGMGGMKAVIRKASVHLKLTGEASSEYRKV